MRYEDFLTIVVSLSIVIGFIGMTYFATRRLNETPKN